MLIFYKFYKNRWRDQNRNYTNCTGWAIKQMIFSNFYYKFQLLLFRALKRGIKLAPSSADLEIADGLCGM